MSDINTLLPLVMRDVGVIAKARRNTAQSYNFRSIDDALNVVSPVLQQHGISLRVQAHDYKTETIQEPKPRGEGVRTVYRASLMLDVTFTAPDGSTAVYTTAGEGQDFGGDKATNKALSAAYKYALFLGLAIPVAPTEIDDSDRDESKPAPTQPPATPLPPGQSPTQPPWATNVALDASPCTEEQQQAIIALAQSLGMPPEALTVAVAKRGKQRLCHLNHAEAADLYGNLVSLQQRTAPSGEDGKAPF